jgi:hypothetical protein
VTHAQDIQESVSKRVVVSDAQCFEAKKAQNDEGQLKNTGSAKSAWTWRTWRNVRVACVCNMRRRVRQNMSR